MLHINKPLLAIAVAAILFTACRKSDVEVTPSKNAAYASSISSTAKQGGTARPFNGSMTLMPSTQSLSCDCSAPSTSIGTYAGSGNRTHLGNTSLKIASCVVPIMQGGNMVGYDVTSVCVEMISADGDQLFTYTYPYALMFGPTGGTGTIQVDFTGGTGKFASATGSFTGTMTISGTGVATFDNIDGTIAY